MVEGIQIDQYNKSGLKKLIEDSRFLEEKTYPISPERARSLLNNPRVEEEDILLITARENGRVIAFRTAMSDHIVKNGEKLRFAWICGSWVDPAWRRQRLATKLFLLLNEAWDSHLAYTNYAPVSKKLYDKTQVFEEYQHHDGYRFYMRFNAATILLNHYPWLRPFKWVLKSMDFILNSILRPILTRGVSSPSYRIENLTDLSWNEASPWFVNSLCGRAEEEFNWIVNHPWVIDRSFSKGLKPERYYFSWISDPYYRGVLCFEAGGRMNRLFISQKDSQLKIPYMDVADGAWDEAARVVLCEARKRKVGEVDSYQENLYKHMLKYRHSFIVSKGHERKYMVSKHILDKFPDCISVQIPDGEGDVAFI